jgi:hypothetical protein
VLALSPEGDPYRPMCLHNLASALHVRFEQTEKQEDLNESIQYHREALIVRSEGHRDRSMSLNGLADALLTQIEHIRQAGKQSSLLFP